MSPLELTFGIHAIPAFGPSKQVDVSEGAQGAGSSTASVICADSGQLGLVLIIVL